MKKLVIAATILAASGATAASAKHFAGSELLPQAKISLAKARASAVRAHPGVITDQELEKEGGGSGLRYSFDIKNKGIAPRAFIFGITNPVMVQGAIFAKITITEGLSRRLEGVIGNGDWVRVDPARKRIEVLRRSQADR